MNKLGKNVLNRTLAVTVSFRNKGLVRALNYEVNFKLLLNLPQTSSKFQFHMSFIKLSDLSPVTWGERYIKTYQAIGKPFYVGK